MGYVATANAMMLMFSAPAFKSTCAHSRSVAPVVTRSSTSSTCFPLMALRCGVANPLATFLMRSCFFLYVCELLCTTRCSQLLW